MLGVILFHDAMDCSIRVMSFRLRKRLPFAVLTYTVALIAFLIPTNLFLKYVYDGAFVNGTLVDYLLPKLYLSDIPILILLAMWIPKIPNSAKKLLFLFLAFAGTHLLFLSINAEAQSSMLSTLWFLAKLGEIVLFALWCIEHSSLQWFQKGVVIGLFFAIGVQAAVGIFQYTFQRSLGGYRFFGEPALEQSPIIARSELSGTIRMLAYGTTPHPNILAGFAAISILIIIAFIHRKKIENKHRYIGLLCVVLCIVICITQSLSALLAFIFGLATWVVALHNKQNIHKKMSTLVVFGMMILVLAPVVLYGIEYFQHTKAYDNQNTSVLRRVQLQSIALSAFSSQWLAGVGLNQLTTRSEEFGMVSATTRFLQPVHHVPLLWLAETGVTGFLFIILFIFFGNKYYSLNSSYIFLLFIPFFILLSLDHYLFTLQHGQLLSAILIGFFLVKKS